jgi:hypothetical protein
MDEDLNIAARTSEYEAQLLMEAEKNEEFHNEFYKSPGLPGTNAGLEIPEDVLSESEPEEDKASIDEYVEEYLRSANIDHKFTPLTQSNNKEDFEAVKLNSNLKVLSPVRKAEIKELDITPLKAINEVDYRNFLHQEIGEPREMYFMRQHIAEILTSTEIPRGSRFVSMDTQTIILLSRMITNKLWFGMTYNKDQEELIASVIKYAPELNI